MFIQQITIENLGSIDFYKAELAQNLNLIGSLCGKEIAAAIGFVLCSQPPTAMPASWLGANTRISAMVRSEDASYKVMGNMESGQLRLRVKDTKGEDATACYQYALSHCGEQDCIETFDGQDEAISLRLYGYRWREENDGLSARTQRLADTHTFRRYLSEYIRDFHPEPINSKKNYRMEISPQGEFYASCPNIQGRATLSETEEKLFRYLCFLNIAEFWTGFEKMRDLHHEKKPLRISNFLELLDESTNISGFLARTQKLQRQIIILTLPMDETLKKKWLGG